MRRATVLTAILGAAVAVAGVQGVALAGGGCHQGMTEADATGRDETTVHMADACFSASVTRVDPGTDVTFVNEDPMLHNVGGTEWGFYGEMRQGDTFRARFADPGVYPFACSYHPGMTGAIVVGGGKGAGAGWTVLSDPVEPATERAPTTTAVAETPSTSPLALVGIGLLGAALGAVAAIALRGVRKPAAA
jgi:plastocyanin